MNSDESFIFNKESIPVIKHICNDMPRGFFIYRADKDEELIYANNAMIELFSCKDMEDFKSLVGNSFKGIVHPDDYKRVSRSIEEQIKNNSQNIDYVDYRIICRDGTVKWVADFGRYMETVDYGGIYYVFLDDATERVNERMNELERINQVLKNNIARSEQYRQALLHNVLALIEINLTKKTFISVSTNKRKKHTDTFDYIDFSKIKNYDDAIEALLQRVNSNIVPECYNFFNINRLIRCYENDEPVQVLDCEVSDVNGNKRLFEYVMWLGKNEFTKNIIAMTIIDDITEKTEKQNFFMNALSNANAENIAKKNFINNITHNILSQMNNITNFTQLISYNSSDKGLLDYCLNKIKNANEQILDYINKSIEFIDANSNKISLDKLKFNIIDMLNDLKRRISSEAISKQIHIEIDKENLHNSDVCADEARLSEVLWQLLDNAVKYTNHGGKIIMRVSENEGSSDKSRKYEFDIIDNGTGMEKNAVEKIFERTGSQISGGMGLAVVKNIVDMMNASIKAESELGKGSRFTISVEFPVDNS